MNGAQGYAGTWLGKAHDLAPDLRSGKVRKVVVALKLLDEHWPDLKDEREKQCRRANNTGVAEAWEQVRDYPVTLEEYFLLRSRKHLWVDLDDWSKDAQEACEKLGDTLALAAAHRLRGRALAGRGKPDGALEEFDEGLKLVADPQVITERKERVRLLRDRARLFCLMPAPNLDAALRDVEEGLQLAIGARDLKREEAEILNIKGYIHRRKNRERGTEEALACWKGSESILKKLGHEVLAARVQANIGLVHKDKGNYDQAKACFDQILTVYQQLEENNSVARALADLGTIHYDLGDYPAAIKAHTKSLNLFDSLGSPVDEAKQLLNLAEIHIAQGDCSEAERNLTAAAGKLKQQSDPEPYANLRRLHAELCLARGDTKDALSLAREALLLAKDIPPPLKADFYATQARVYEAKGDIVEARNVWQQALHIYRDVMGNAFLAGKVEDKLHTLNPKASAPKESEPQLETESHPYDVFISYSHRDKKWVRDWLLPQLEAAGLHVYIDYRDFEPGVPALVNMENAVERSRKTLIVLTPAWIESEWTTFGSLLVQTDDPAGRRARMIPLRLEPCEPPKRIAMLTYLDFAEPSEVEVQLHRLVTAIRDEPMPAVPWPAPEPGDSADRSREQSTYDGHYLRARKQSLEKELTQTVADMAKVERRYRTTASVIERNRLDLELEVLRDNLDRLQHDYETVCQALGEKPSTLPDDLAQQLLRIEKSVTSIQPETIKTEESSKETWDEIVGPVDRAHTEAYDPLRLDAAVPDRVYLDRTFELATAVRRQSSPVLNEDDLTRVRSGDVQVSWPEAGHCTRLRVKVSAPECEIGGPDSHAFRLYPGHDSPVFYFHLTPKKLGEIGIIVKVYQEHDWLGSTRVHTVVHEQIVGSVQMTITSYTLVRQLESIDEKVTSIQDVTIRTEETLKKMQEETVEAANTILSALDGQTAEIVADIEEAIAGEAFSGEEMERLVGQLQLAVGRVQALSGLPEGIDARIQESIKQLDPILSSEMDVHNKLKLTIPIIPLLLVHEIELELADLNLKALWDKLTKRIRRN